MKKIFIICMLLCSIVTYSQESKSLEETVKPYVEKLLNGIEQGAELAIEEIPIVLKEYVMFEALTSWLLVLLGIILIPLGIKLHKKWWDNMDTPVSIGGPIISCSGCIIIIYNIFTAIKATFFPKLFIVESFLNYI